MVAEPERERTRLEASRMANLTTGANMTGVNNFTNNMTGVHNLTNTPGLNVTPAPPSLDLTGVTGPALDMTAAPNLDVSNAPPALNLTSAAPSLNLTNAPPTLNLTNAPNGTGCAPPTLNLTGGANVDMGDDLASQTANLSLEEVPFPLKL